MTAPAGSGEHEALTAVADYGDVVVTSVSGAWRLRLSPAAARLTAARLIEACCEADTVCRLRLGYWP